jgi:hypothetical protein
MQIMHGAGLVRDGLYWWVLITAGLIAYFAAGLLVISPGGFVYHRCSSRTTLEPFEPVETGLVE